MSLSFYRDFLDSLDWQGSGDFITPDVRQWVLHQESLTEKLREVCDNLSVRVIQQGWVEKSFRKETALSKVWLREVILEGDGSPWVFAQTILADDTIKNVAQYVLQLNDEPIGLWLFKQPVRRTSLIWQQDVCTGLYARCSEFDLRGYPLQIKELFLPDFLFP